MTLYLVGLFGLVVAGAVAFIFLRPSAQQKKYASATAAKADLELLEHQSRNINFFKYVTGTIRNNSGKTYAQVRVDISIYVNNGVLIGNTSTSTTNLAPGGKWEFQAPVLEQGEFSYKFTSISGDQTELTTNF